MSKIFAITALIIVIVLAFSKFTSAKTEVGEHFSMKVEDMFDVTGQATVVVGTVETGSLRVNDTVQLIGLVNPISKRVGNISKEDSGDISVAKVGDKVGVLFLNTLKSDIQSLQYLKKYLLA